MLGAVFVYTQPYMDTINHGSSLYQIKVLSDRIARFVLHREQNKKDLHSYRGFLKMIATRRKHLAYLKRTNEEDYATALTYIKEKKN